MSTPYMTGNGLALGRNHARADGARMIVSGNPDPRAIVVLTWRDGAEVRRIFEGDGARGDAQACLARLGWKEAPRPASR